MVVAPVYSKFLRKHSSYGFQLVCYTKAGAQCRWSVIPEVITNQPQEAACEGCGGGGLEYCLRPYAPDAAAR